MLTTYIIEEKRAGHYGYSDFLMVRGTHVTIANGRLQVWNRRHEGALANRAVASVPIERVVSFKGQAPAHHADLANHLTDVA
jgi:hypothetical protein